MSAETSPRESLLGRTPPAAPKIEINGERYYAESEVVAALAAMYRLSTATAVQIADLCDKSLDPSGRLLGIVRRAARG